MRSCVARSHAAEVLKDGDLVLAVNGQPVTSYGHVETIVAACSLADQVTSIPLHQSTGSASPSSITSTVPAELLQSKTNSPQRLTQKPEQAVEAAVTDTKTQHQDDSHTLIKAARPDDFGLPVASQEGTMAMPQVSVTICRGAKVQEVEVQLGSEDGLGTRRLIHWCGAMFQVSQRSPCITLSHTSIFFSFLSFFLSFCLSFFIHLCNQLRTHAHAFIHSFMLLHLG